MNDIEILPYGDSALLVNFEQRISIEVNNRVLGLNTAILEKEWPFIEFTIPAYCSLTVGFNREMTSLESIRDLIEGLIVNNSRMHEMTEQRLVTIPAIFDSSSGPDNERVNRYTGLNWDSFTNQFLQNEFHVFMIGFIAGFPYMGPLPEELRCPRHPTPRVSVPAGSIAIAENQCGIYPVDSPGGWNIIGKTPVPLLDTYEGTFLFKAGDRVRFREISQREFEKISTMSEHGSDQYEIDHG